MADTKQSWEQIVFEKRTARDKLLAPYLVDDADQRPPKVLQVHGRSKLSDDPEGQDITDIDNVKALQQAIQEGRFTAEKAVESYIKRVVIAHQLTNCLTEVMFQEALEEARKLDADFQRTHQPKGPLHGVPITVKDQFNVKGVDTTLGYVGRSFKPAENDAVLVQILKDAGAIVVAKTNLPQSIMWAETNNPLWGLTTNPRNPAFTPSGSTGGESVLQTLNASILGFGTDLGGSIRMPQAVAGLYGLRPSSKRYPYEGVPVSIEGQEHIPSTVGPMARDLDSISYITRIVADSRPWDLDPRCIPLPWNETAFREIQDRPMVIGLIVDDGVVRVHPPIERALNELSEVLNANGHEVVLWDTSDHAECVRLVDQHYVVDGGEDVRRDVGVAGEPLVPQIEALLKKGKAISVYEYWQMNRLKFASQKKYLDKWQATKSASGKPVDVLLAPTLAHTSVPHGKFNWIGYTKIWNFLDYSALTFPVDRVRADRDQLPAEPYVPRNELDEWNWNLYNAEELDGYPVNLQIIGKKYEEERVLGAATAIEKMWKSRAQ